MPYIVTPGTQTTYSGTNYESTAVETIEEARDLVYETLSARYLRGRREYGATELSVRANAMTSRGGQIGPLPDGFVIDVQKVSPLKMAALSGGRVTGQMLLDCLRADDFSPAYDAFNDR